MQIAIVDDIASEREQLRKRLEKYIVIHSLHADIFEYENGETFLDAAQKHTFNVLFLDIYMNGTNGIDVAKKLRTFNTECLLIFTTTSTDHALEGFRVRAMHYLVKPYTEKEINALIFEIIQRIPSPDKYIDVKFNSQSFRLRYKDIVYAEHFSHQMYIKLSSGKTINIRQTFSNFIIPLKEDKRFFVCGRGIIVNLEHVTDLNGNNFIMDDDSAVGISRDLVKTARQTFMDFLFERRHI